MKKKEFTFNNLIITTIAGIALCPGYHASAQLPNPEEDLKLELEVPIVEQKPEEGADDSEVYDFIFDLMIELELEGIGLDQRAEMFAELAELFGVDFATLVGLADSLGFDLNKIDLPGLEGGSNPFTDSSRSEGESGELGGAGLGSGILDPMNLPTGFSGPPNGIPTTGFASNATVTKDLFGVNNEGVQITKTFENENGNSVTNTLVIHPNGLRESIHHETEGQNQSTHVKRSDGSGSESQISGIREYEVIYDGPNQTYRETRWYRNGRLITTQPLPPRWFFNNPTQLPREDQASSALADWLFARFNVGKHSPDGMGANVPVHVNPANGDVISEAPSLFGGVIDPDSLVINPDPDGSPDTSMAPNARVIEGLRDQIYTGTGGGLTPGPKPGTPEFGKEIEAAASKD